MKIELWFIGKSAKELNNLIAMYEKRISRYVHFSIRYLPDSKKTEGSRQDLIKKQEAAHVLKQLQAGDYLILLDEKGARYNSVAFSEKLQHLCHSGRKRIIFLTGGAYGFHQSVYLKKNEMISFSDMTFSHQIIRIMLLEQLYRAFTIMQGEPYHHA
jgi:23S rRNA (pseudouridine1915-N3)-methyltransferase